MGKTFLSLLTWLTTSLRTKAGVFALGLLIGAASPSVMVYLLYRDGIIKDERFLMEVTRSREIEKEKDLWQKTAFEAEDTCLEKLKGVADFFNALEKEYKKDEKISRENIDKAKQNTRKN